MKDLEKKVLQLLKDQSFNVKGYYSYDSVTDIVGYFDPKPPFQIPTRVIIEIRTDELTSEDVDGFSKLAKNTLADKRILFSVKPFEELGPETQSLVSKAGCEYFDFESLEKILEETRRTAIDVSELTNSCDLFSAKRLSEVLPDLAKQKVPTDIRNFFPKRQAWEILEDAVFSIFNFCFGYETKKLGGQSLFEHEPEGMVVCNSRNGSRYGLIYDCKSSKSSYKMTKQDELTYISYIKDKKIEFKSLYNCELRYFLIISPDFSGDLNQRRNSILHATSVLLTLIKATTLRKVALWAYKLPNNLKPMIDISEFLLSEEIVVSDNTVSRYIRDFDKKHGKRY